MALSGSLNFLSASVLGSVRVAAAADAIEIFYGKEERDTGVSEFIPNDFVGLNTNIYEPITASSNTLGYPEFSVGVLSHPAGSLYANYIMTYAGGRPTNFLASEAQADILNGLLHHRNGPYQHPSWKQIRGGDHPIARSLRLRNTMSVDLDEPDARKREDEKRLLRNELESLSLQRDNYYNSGSNLRYGREATAILVDPLTGEELATIIPAGRQGPLLKRYYEPSVVIKHKPLIYDTTLSNPFSTNNTTTVRSTLMNQMVYFENRELEESMKLAGPYPLSGTQKEAGFKIPNQEYMNLLDVAKSDGFDSKNFIYSQMIFPKSINVFRPFKLSKVNFEEVAGTGTNGYDRVTNRSFWKDSHLGLSSSIESDGTSRIRSMDLALNSQNIVQSMTMSTDNGSSTLTNVAGKRALIATTAPALYNWNHEHKFIQGGIIASDSINTSTGSAAAVGALDVRTAAPSDVNGDSFILTDQDGTNVTFTFNSSTTSVADGAIGVSGVSTRYAMALAVKNSINDSSISLKITASEPSPGSGSPTSAQTITLTQDEAGSSGNTTIDVSGVTNITSTNFAGGIGPLGGDNLLVGITDPPHFTNNESYNPYPLALLSMWPLDVRADIFEGLHSVRTGLGAYTALPYLKSELGGQGIQIGVTPHRMKEYNVRNDNLDADWTGVFLSASLSDSSTSAASSVGDFSLLNNATASYLQLTSIMTGTAGELAYSTKPTMFFHQQASTSELVGYRNQTASLQYNRHAFPYNTPFYVTNRIRHRNPFYNSYSDFIGEVKYLAREYSIVPEYLVSENIEYYVENYFKGVNQGDVIYTTKEVDAYVYDTDQDQYIKKKQTIYNRNINLTEDSTTLMDSEGNLTQSPHTFKLNFLKIHGADPTSSAAAESFVNQTSSQANYNFDTLSLGVENVTNNFSNSKIAWSQDQDASKFHEKYSNTDNIVEFSNILRKFDNGLDTIPTKIEFTVYGLKKLLPYKNFYPVTKTVDIGNKFKNFIYDNLDLTPKITAAGVDYGYEAGSNSVQPDISAGALQSFLEPFMAPGILYNSLKSGVAVDFPVYERKPAYFAPFTFFSGAINPRSQYAGSLKHTGWSTDAWKNGELDNSLENVTNRFTEVVTSSFTYGGFQQLGASRCIPAILNRAHTRRIPFETLYNVDLLDRYASDGGGQAIYLTTDFLDLDINGVVSQSFLKGRDEIVGTDQYYHHPGYAFTNTGPRGRLKKRPSEMTDDVNKLLYKSSINNFLCETMNFFLDDIDGIEGLKLPVAVSDPREKHAFSEDTAYSMEVSLQMGEHHVMAEGPRNAGIGGGQHVSNRYANDTLNASMRGYIYGPPSEIVQMSGSSTIAAFVDALDPAFNPDTPEFSLTEPYIASPVSVGVSSNGHTGHLGSGLRQITGSHGDYESYFGANLQDPAYQAYTPPYFYGKSSMVLLLPQTHDVTEAQPEQALASVRSSLSNIYIESYVTGAHTNALCRHIPGTSSISLLTQEGGRMKIAASVDVFTAFDPIQLTKLTEDSEGITQAETYVSYIAPKWVCPVLDFSSSYSSIRSSYVDKETGKKHVTYSHVTNSFHDTTTGKGLWGGYGMDPYSYGTRSIHKNILNEKFEKGIYFAIDFPQAVNQKTGSYAVSYTQGYNNNPGVNAIFTDVPFTKDGSTDSSICTYSLAHKLGFSSSENESIKYQIGRMARKKDISEAVVIIPYFERPIHIALEKPEDLDTPEEFFTTREIIPGKHFLPIHEKLFANILSISIHENKNEIQGQQWLDSYLDSDEPRPGFDSEEEYYAAKETDVYKLIDTIMGSQADNRPGYELPPEFDFVHYNVLPFQMIVVPLNHTLDSQELVDIYQGIMPESSLKAEKVRSTATTRPGMSTSSNYTWMPGINLPSGTRTLSDISPQNFLNPSFIQVKDSIAINSNSSINHKWLNNSRAFYKNLKFMVFKVKQKGEKDYETYRQKQIERAIIKKSQNLEDYNNRLTYSTLNSFKKTRTFQEVFGHNWPYDDFSLTEAIKIDIGMEIDT